MALDDPQRDMIDVTQITIPDHSRSIFIGKLPVYVTPEAQQRIVMVWRNLWVASGLGPAPPLLLLEAGFEITALSDAELRNVGLMRVPDGG